MLDQVKKLMKEVALETFKYYEMDSNRRAYNKQTHSCSYYLKGKKCAVGRCLKAPKKTEEAFCNEAVNFPILRNLQKRYQSLVSYLRFWQELQDFHDSDRFWTRSGKVLARKQKKSFILNWIEKEEFNNANP